ncbi:MAG: rhomboid family intramembrane serine protease [Bacteroidota bacterium]
MTPHPDQPEATPPAAPEFRPREPIFNLPPGTLWLALAMIAVFVLESLLEGPAWSWLLNTFAFVSTAFWPPGAALPTAQGVMTLVSHAFLHADLVHLALNLGFLLAFGSFVERHLGLARYLLVFALTAAAGALTEYALRGGEPLALIGASGAVYGMTGAAIRFMFAGGGAARRRGALGFVGVFLGLNLVLGLTGLGDLLAGAAVGWKAHAGGFLAGALLSVLLGPRGLTRRGPA